MELKLEELINKEKFKSCLILGPGPTMTDFPFKKFKGKIIVIGDAALRGKLLFKPDYWVISNNHFPVPYINLHRKIINEYKKTFFLFSDSTLHDLLWKKIDSVMKNKLKVNWAYFDDRHFQFKKCNPELKCCKYIRKKRDYSTIQELVSGTFNFKKVASRGGSVFEHALALSLLLGFSKIYIQGVDLPFKKKTLDIKIDNEWSTFSRQGYKYSEKVNKKILEKIAKIGTKTNKIISRKSSEVFKEDNNLFFYLVYKILKKIKKTFWRENWSAFLKNKKLILRNVSIYAEIAKRNNIKICNLSKK